MSTRSNTPSISRPRSALRPARAGRTVTRDAQGDEGMTGTRPRPDLSRVWRLYKRVGDQSIRNVLIESYMHIVRYNAERIGAKLPDEVDHDDLVSAGVFGLMDAIDAFDLERGVKFETYCAPRIRGAILDELRNMDWVPRLVRSRAAKLERVVRELEAELGRSPVKDEIADKLRVSRDELSRLVREATAVTQVSLSRKCNEGETGRDVHEIDVIEDRKGRDPLNDVQRRDLRDLLTRGMTRAERMILTLYYYEEMTMKEIGETLNLSESRVSQMHTAIMERLKEQMRLRRKEFVQ